MLELSELLVFELLTSLTTLVGVALGVVILELGVTIGSFVVSILFFSTFSSVLMLTVGVSLVTFDVVFELDYCVELPHILLDDVDVFLLLFEFEDELFLLVYVELYGQIPFVCKCAGCPPQW